MRRVEQKEYFYTLSKYNKPVITIKPGETVVFVTADNTGNLIKREEDFEKVATIKEWNPMSGPFFVEGAKPGDTLTIYINDIKPLFGQGWGGAEPGSVSAAGHVEAPFGLYLVDEPRPDTFYICPVENDVVKLPLKSGKQISIRSRPLIGTIGTAPELDQSIAAMLSGKFGGNMDCPDISRGNKLFLPVYTEGAFLYVGDVHALQGDGELGGMPVEVAAECTLTIDLIKGKTIHWPRIESPEYIITVGNSSPIDNSLRIANTGMIHWLRDDYGFSLEDAMFLGATVFRVQVNQAVVPASSVSVKFPRKYLPEI